ncbi:quinone oxidoreductase family protein [Archangium lipolyticum]|uniref:quinone oxidoreductase family protein n=1 Tax=Archangium lipolyticum TaxID=2970465 RepID=UPI002149FCFE|nr:NADP-dependent oxidoreductase [Archangium lipolyticum]
MRVITQQAFGGVEQLVEEDWPLPEPGPGEVRVRIRAASFNPIDVYFRRGGFGGRLPQVLGRDFSGVVDALGEGVKGLAVGDAVYCYRAGQGSNGSHAEYICMPALLVLPKPARLGFLEAAALPVVALTAWQSVARARVQRGEAVFVAGGSGGVGSMALQILRHLGAHPLLTTAGGDASADYLVRQLGVEPGHILRYRGLSRERLLSEVLAMNGGRHVPVALDFVGGTMKELCFDVAAVEGRVVSIVEEPADSPINLWDEARSPLILRSLEFHFIQLGARALYAPRETWSVYREQLGTISRLIEEGALNPPAVRSVGPLSAVSVREAHRLLEEGRVQGKLVVECG